MYHFSLNLLFSKVIIRKNRESKAEQLTVLRWELVRSHLALLQRPKWHGDGVRDVTGAGGGTLSCPEQGDGDPPLIF